MENNTSMFETFEKIKMDEIYVDLIQRANSCSTSHELKKINHEIKEVYKMMKDKTFTDLMESTPMKFIDKIEPIMERKEKEFKQNFIQRSLIISNAIMILVTCILAWAAVKQTDILNKTYHETLKNNAAAQKPLIEKDQPMRVKFVAK